VLFWRIINKTDEKSKYLSSEKIYAIWKDVVENRNEYILECNTLERITYLLEYWSLLEEIGKNYEADSNKEIVYEKYQIGKIESIRFVDKKKMIDKILKFNK